VGIELYARIAGPPFPKCIERYAGDPNRLPFWVGNYRETVGPIWLTSPGLDEDLARPVHHLHHQIHVLANVQRNPESISIAEPIAVQQTDPSAPAIDVHATTSLVESNLGHSTMMTQSAVP
jgi:hypothetical protein